MRRCGIFLAFTCALLTSGSSARCEPHTAVPITFTYDIMTGSCTASLGNCRNLPTHAVCGPDLGFEEIARNNAALRAFNAEAQRHTRPAEPGYAGGNYIPGPGYPWRAAGDAYPDANIDNVIVLKISACNKLQYTWNAFTMLVRNIKVAGAGSAETVLQNVNSHYFHDDVAGRTNYDFFGDGFYGVVNNTYPADAYGYLINSAKGNATEVKLKFAGDVKSFYVGRWVLVMSYVQDSMGSYPPNMRYYDFAKVKAIEPASGVVYLDTPLAFDHLSSRPYDGTVLHVEPSIAGNGIGAGIVGPARIVNIDTPFKPVTVTFQLDGIHFLRNPRSRLVTEYSDGWEFTGTIDARSDDLLFDGAVDTAEMRSFTLTNSRAFYEEADKIIATATYVNDTFVSSLLHSGQLLWHATGGAYGGDGSGEVSCAALNCVIDGGAVLTAAQRVANVHPDMELDRVGFTNNLSFDNVTFKGRGSLGNAAINAWQGIPQTIGSSGISLQSGPNGKDTRLVVSKCVSRPVDCTDMQIGRTIAQEVTSNWGDGSTLIRNGRLFPGATITSITGDRDSLYVDVKSTNSSRWGLCLFFARKQFKRYQLDLHRHRKRLSCFRRPVRMRPLPRRGKHTRYCMVSKYRRMTPGAITGSVHPLRKAASPSGRNPREPRPLLGLHSGDGSRRWQLPGRRLICYPAAHLHNVTWLKIVTLRELHGKIFTLDQSDHVKPDRRPLAYRLFGITVGPNC